MKNKDRITLWINSILDEVSHLDEKKGMEILHACGKECSKTSALLEGAVKIREKYKEDKDIDKLFTAFKTQYCNTSRLTKVGNEIILIFEECTCPLVEQGVGHSYLCNCTVGYTKQLFETLFGRKVKVKLLKSILNGDSICKQKILSPPSL